MWYCFAKVALVSAMLITGINRQNNRKYNICTLVPMVLFNQFKFFYNFFFLVIALT